MKIGDVLLVRRGGAYGLVDIDSSEGEILSSGEAVILLKKVSKKTADNKWIIVCQILTDFGPLWIVEGVLQRFNKNGRLKCYHLKKYDEPQKDAPIIG